MCDLCGKREPQLQNTDMVNLGMTEGYAQDMIDLINDFKDGSTQYDDGVDGLVRELKDKLSYLADHLAAL